VNDVETVVDVRKFSWSPFVRFAGPTFTVFCGLFRHSAPRDVAELTRATA
jgi:hypothetical protein